MNVLAFWPIIKWVLQALGLMGPEDKEAERKYKLTLLEAQARKDEGLIKAFADFQTGQSQVLKALQAVLVAALYYDTFWGQQRTIATAQQLFEAGIPGLLITSILLFPFYGPALVAGVSRAFDTMIDLTVRRSAGPSSRPEPVLRPEPGHLPEPDRAEALPSSPHPYTRGSGFRRETDPELGSPSGGNEVR